MLSIKQTLVQFQNYHVIKLVTFGFKSRAQNRNLIRLGSEYGGWWVIKEVLDDKLELRRQTKEAIQAKMTEHGYEHIEGDTEYKYLLKMPMDSVTDENVKHLLAERDMKRTQHQQLTDTTIQALWTKDLDELDTEYRKWAAAAEAASVAMGITASAGGGAASKKKMVIKK